MSFLRGWQEETFKNRISILKFIFSQCRNTLFYVKVNQYMLCIFCGWFTVSSYSYVIWTLGHSNFHHHILKLLTYVGDPRFRIYKKVEVKQAYILFRKITSWWRGWGRIIYFIRGRYLSRYKLRWFCTIYQLPFVTLLIWVNVPIS